MVYTFISKITSVLTNTLKRVQAFLLQEDSAFILLEDGGKIFLDRGIVYSDTSKNTSAYTNTIKN